jgi:hypothetical protein
MNQNRLVVARGACIVYEVSSIAAWRQFPVMGYADPSVFIRDAEPRALA